MKKKIDYIGDNSKKIINRLIQSGGLKSIRSQHGSPYDDCEATIFYESNDDQRFMMSVRSIRSSNQITKIVKDHFMKKNELPITKEKKRERKFTESQVLDILSIFASTTDTHWMSRDSNDCREWIKEHHLKHLLDQIH